MGLVGPMDIVDNMMIRSYKKGGFFWADRRSPRTLAEHIIDELQVVTPGVNTPVGKLSGGNVQKVLVGREIASNPVVLMVAYPVRGLDINSSYTIYNLLSEQKKHGVAVLWCGGGSGRADGFVRPHSGHVQRSNHGRGRRAYRLEGRNRRTDDAGWKGELNHVESTSRRARAAVRHLQA